MKPINYIPLDSRLTFIEKSTFKNNRNRIKGYYSCICGNTKELFISDVKNGHVRSCGCIRKETPNFKTHMLRSHPLYSVWLGMRSRCYKNYNDMYHAYGAKGVKVCDEWLTDFKAFYDWSMSNGYKKGLQIDKDKIPKQKGVEPILYSPETCCFLTPKENCNLKKNNRVIDFNGVSKNLCQWAEDLHLTTYAIYNRINKYKWTIEKALTTPLIVITKNN